MYHYKDNTPEESVNTFKKILKNIKLEVIENWNEVSSIGTYSVRVSLKDYPELGTNGKGIDRNYALASAYGEFFERLQNNILIPRGKIDKNQNFYLYKDEKLYSAYEIAIMKSTVMDSFFEESNLSNEITETKAKLFDAIFKVHSVEGKYICIPFADIINGRIEYVPVVILEHYGSNGMCAGNKCEEALVQGFSEVYERASFCGIYQEELSFHMLLNEIEEKNSNIKQMMSLIRQNEMYDISLMECSLDINIPVVALLIIEKNTGRYGISFGCHPDIEIAIERALTEAAQGQDIYSFPRNRVSAETRYLTRKNFINLLSAGVGKYPTSVFQSISDVPRIVEAVHYSSNEELLKVILACIKERKMNVLIRDNSILGIPTYQIIIPDLSNLTKINAKEIVTLGEYYKIGRYLKTPSLIDEEIAKKIIEILEYFLDSIIYGRLHSIYKRKDKFIYPYSNQKMDMVYFLSMLYYMVGNIPKSIFYLDIVEGCKKLSKNEKTWISAVKLFLQLEYDGEYCNDRVKILTKFYDEKVVDDLKRCFSKKEKVIKEQYYDEMSSKYDESYVELRTLLKRLELGRQIDQYSLLKIIQELQKEGI